MIVALLLLIAVVTGVVYFRKKNPTYSPEQEAQELIAKAGAEAKQIEAEFEKEVADVEANIRTPLINSTKL